MKNSKRQQDLHPFDEMAKRGLTMMSEQERLASTARLKKRFDVAYRPKNNRISMKVLSIAATVALLITAGYFLRPTPEVSTLELAPTELMDVAPLSAVRSVLPPSEILLSNAVTAYEQSKFPEAAKLFRAYLTSGGDKKEALLFVGHCELQFTPETAVSTLLEFKNTAGKSLDANYSDLADWYLAWAYFKLDKPDEAIAVLNGLVEHSPPFRDKAQSFIGRIRPIHR